MRNGGHVKAHEVVEQLVVAGGDAAELHDGAAPLFEAVVSSIPKLDPRWLDSLRQDPELVAAYGHR
jgi:peptide/nickel transport system ATP-binding protein